jgi:[ribosomal protein S18]-alanine N-acetyltransferase
LQEPAPLTPAAVRTTDVAIARRPDDRQPLSSMDLVRMRRRHLKRVMAIESLVYPRPWSLTLFLSEIAQRNTRTYLVARDEGYVIGYAGMMFTGREAHVTNIAVDPEYQGRKVGSRLLLALITEAIAKGADTLSLEVRVSNIGAQNMYARFGFETSSVRRGYYVETREDAYVMLVRDARSTEYRLRLQVIRNELDALLGEESGPESSDEVDRDG